MNDWSGKGKRFWRSTSLRRSQLRCANARFAVQSGESSGVKTFRKHVTRSFTEGAKEERSTLGSLSRECAKAAGIGSKSVANSNQTFVTHFRSVGNWTVPLMVLSKELREKSSRNAKQLESVLTWYVAFCQQKNFLTDRQSISFS